MTGSASDWQLRRLPPLCLVCSEPREALPGGARGVSQAQLPTPSSATYVRLPAAPRPRPATPSPSSARSPELRRTRRRRRRRRPWWRLSSRGAVIRSRQTIDGRRSGFHGGVSFRQERGAGVAESEAAGRAPSEGRPRTSPRVARPGSPRRRDPPLPSPAPGGPACATLARLFRGSRGLAHGSGHLFRPSRWTGFVDVEIRVKEATKRNFKRNPTLSSRVGSDATPAAGRRCLPRFTLPGGPELVLILSAPIESPPSTPSALWICFLPDLDIFLIS